MRVIRLGKLCTKEYGDKIRLCCNINKDNSDYELWLEVDKEYGEYLTYERSDSFVSIMLYCAMKNGYDIVCETPMTEQLHFQITEILIPTVCEAIPEFHKISITCPTESFPISKKCKPGGVGTALSCGVDSLYTILRHEKNIDSSFDITHFTFFYAGSSGVKGMDRTLLEERLSHVRKFAIKKGKPLVFVDSNIPEYFNDYDYLASVAYKCMGFVLALQKLFRYYFFSSSYKITEFHISAEACDYYDRLIAQCMSFAGLTFEIGGNGVSRGDKEEYLSNRPEVYDSLNICNKYSYNCCKCEKCIRTISSLYAIGKLDRFDKVFDIEKFLNNKTYYFAIMIADGREWYLDTLKKIRKNGERIPIMSYWLGFWYHPILHPADRSFIMRVRRVFILKISMKARQLNRDIF